MQRVVFGTVCALLAVTVTVTAAANGAAPTPAQYRAHLNAICRGYTPLFKLTEAAGALATRNHNEKAFFASIGEALGLDLLQDRKLLAVPVPAAIATQMRPVLGALKQLDTQIRTYINSHPANAKVALAGYAKIYATTHHANKLLDGAGLRACGSKQA